MDDKSTLRQKKRDLRKTLSKEEKSSKSALIAQALVQHPLFQTAITVLTYLANEEEVDTLTLIRDHFNEKQWIIPSLNRETKALELFHLEQWLELSEGHFGILEIQHNGRKPFKGTPDLIVVPGIAFDSTGHRIGYGKGYYDELLKRFPKIPTIGLAFNCQLLKKIPTEPHDIAIKYLLTESKILTF